MNPIAIIIVDLELKFELGSNHNGRNLHFDLLENARNFPFDLRVLELFFWPRFTAGAKFCKNIFDLVSISWGH